MTEHGVRNPQDALDLLDLGLVEVELLDDVMPFPLILDAVGQPALPPGGDLLDLAPVRLDQLADLIDLLLDRLIIKLRLDDIHQLVRRQSGPPFLRDLLRLWPHGRQRSRKASVSLAKINGRPGPKKSGRRVATAHGGKPKARYFFTRPDSISPDHLPVGVPGISMNSLKRFRSCSTLRGVACASVSPASPTIPAGGS